MRPPRNKIPLCLETMVSTMVPGKQYTVTVLRLIYTGTRSELLEVLEDGFNRGILGRSGENVRGFKQRYWRREEFQWSVSEVATRRTGPNEVAAELHGYDLMKNSRICNNFRRS